MKNICIIGSGSWGTALGIHLAKLGNNVKMWSYNKDEADMINNDKRCKFLPNVIIPDGIFCTTSFEEAVKGSDIILHVTPSKVVRETLKQYKEFITNQPIVICSKGFEKATLSSLDSVVKDEVPNATIVALSGPSHAEEVSIGIPTAIVIACEDINIANEIRDIFMNENLRIYTSTDVRGVELRRSIKKYYCFMCRCCS